MDIVALAQILAATATGVLALLTFLYVKATQEMVKANRDMVDQMRQTNERLDQPNVEVILEPGQRQGSLFELAVKNTGAVSVYDVRISVSPTDYPGLTVEHLGDLNLFRTPIPILTETQEIRTILFHYNEVIESVGTDGQSSTMTFRVTYSTPRGEEKSQTYAYDLNLYNELTDFSEAALKDVVKVLKELKTETKAVSSAAQKVSERLEWDMKLSSTLHEGNDLQASLQHFLTMWEDFGSLGKRAFIGFNCHKISVLCEKTYDQLCRYGHSSEGYEEIRSKLLKMSRVDFRLGSEPVQDFSTLGNEVAEMIRGLDDGDGAPHKPL